MSGIILPERWNGVENVEAPVPVIARTCYRVDERGFSVPTVCNFAQEELEYKGYEIKLQWGVPLLV